MLTDVGLLNARQQGETWFLVLVKLLWMEDAFFPSETRERPLVAKTQRSQTRVLPACAAHVRYADHLAAQQRLLVLTFDGVCFLATLPSPGWIRSTPGNTGAAGIQ